MHEHSTLPGSYGPDPTSMRAARRSAFGRISISRRPRFMGRLAAVLAVALMVASASGQVHGEQSNDDDDVPQPTTAPAASWGSTPWTASGAAVWPSGWESSATGSVVSRTQSVIPFSALRYGAGFPSLRDPVFLGAREMAPSADASLLPTQPQVWTDWNPLSAQQPSRLLDSPLRPLTRLDPLPMRLIVRPGPGSGQHRGPQAMTTSGGIPLTPTSDLLRQLTPRTITDACLANLLDIRSSRAPSGDPWRISPLPAVAPRPALCANGPYLPTPAATPQNLPSPQPPLSIAVPAGASPGTIGAARDGSFGALHGAGSPRPLHLIDLDQLLSGKFVTSPVPPGQKQPVRP